MSLLWCWQQWQQQLPDDYFDDNVSWVDPWNVEVVDRWITLGKECVEDWTNRIGELPYVPKPRSHWPWEVFGMRRQHREEQPPRSPQLFAGVGDLNVVTTVEDEDMDDDDLTVSTTTEEKEETTTPASKKQTCIGSIFGLDVGGTLSKLVYFEQKPHDYDPLTSSHRERNYTMAACAQAVTLARRGTENERQSHLPRRRSFSVGCMGRFKDLQREQEKEEKESHHHRHSTSSGFLPLHSDSESSKFDLRTLNDLRQESLPDDLDQYGASVQFQESQTSFLQDNANNDAQKSQMQDDHKTNNDSSNMMKKSKSMFDLSQSQKKAEALDHFYNFARRLDSYQDSLRDHTLSFYSRELGGEFHFIRFETRWMKNAMDLIKYNHLHLNIAEMGATGGGAHKYADMWEKILGIKMDKQEELESMVAGMQFVLSTVVGECYTFRPKTRELTANTSTGTTESDISQVGADLVSSGSEDSSSFPASAQQPIQEEQKDSKQQQQQKAKQVDEWWWSRKVQRDSVSYSSAYPYMLVTIGTGVSILRVDGPRQHERISGSTIGGGTYWGLMRLLTDVEDFEDLMHLAEKGDPCKVDMMVGDIYGSNPDALEKLGLPSNIVASSFGKLVAKEDPAEGLKQEDLARALLLMVTNNIGQVAYLNAKLHNTPRIYFVGNFLRGNIISQRRLSYAIDYWSKGEMEALFLEHEGYFGALGAFLISQNITHKNAHGFF